MIPRSFIQDLLNRVDIVDVVDRHVKLKRAGANYVACCPFHSEKTPSFTVSQTKQFYHCFGCGAHGTAVGFLMEYGGLGFVDAVKDLAQGVGMQVPEETRPDFARRKEGEDSGDLHSVLLQAAHYYRAQLKDAPQAIAYLKRRGLSGEVAKRFGIGYAPDGWQNLAGAFPDYGAKALQTAGLVKVSDEGRRYDIFRDRIMFPIVDARGNVIGFGGRVLGEGEPKYLNSPETPVFEKGRELYGFYQARRAIRDVERVVVVEGYMDVVALAQHGIEYAVATLGTATTPQHVQKLLRQAEEVVFCFDGDDAGRRAAWRALENSLPQLIDGKQVRFLFLPQGEDPDTYVRGQGKAAFEARLGEAAPLSRFLLDGLAARIDCGTHEGRAKLLRQAKPLVKQVAAPLLSLFLRKKLAELTGLTQQELDAQFQIKTQPVVKAAAKTPPPKSSFLRRLIELLLIAPAFSAKVDRNDVMRGLELDGIDQLELRLLNAMLETPDAGAHPVNMFEQFRGTEFEGLLAEIQGGLLRRPESGFGPEELERQWAGAWESLKEELRWAQFSALNKKAEKQGLTTEEKVVYRDLLSSAKGRFRNENTANLR